MGKRKKITKMNELAWLIGITICAFGVALAAKANFGLSMLAAPPYIIYVKLSETFKWLTYGTTEYLWQLFLLVFVTLTVRKVKFKYFLSFFTGVLFGKLLDLFMMLLGGHGAFESFGMRVFAFFASEILIAIAVALFFRTSLPPESYELVVTEISSKFSLKQNKVKLVNDLAMLTLSLVLSFVLHGKLVGIGIGTVIVTLTNAPLISFFGKILDRFFEFDPRFTKLVEVCNK